MKLFLSVGLAAKDRITRLFCRDLHVDPILRFAICIFGVYKGTWYILPPLPVDLSDLRNRIQTVVVAVTPDKVWEELIYRLTSVPCNKWSFILNLFKDKLYELLFRFVYILHECKLKLIK